MEYYLVVKKRHFEICMQMDEKRKNIRGEVTQTQKDEHGMHSLVSGY